MMGGVLNILGEHAAATEAHLKAIQIDDENASFQNNLGFSYYLQGKYPDAIEAYLAALDIDPGAKRVHNNLGFAYGKMGRLAAAKQHFKLAGLPSQANNNMGFIHESRGELELAYEYYVIALEQNPNLAQAKENLSRICKQLNRPMPEIGIKLTAGDNGGNAASPPPPGS
jgi:Flp pilus assembly protein TadD